MKRFLSRLARVLVRQNGPQTFESEDPWPPVCEICGGPTALHLTEVRGRVKRQRHFCSMHVPNGIPQPTREHELKVIEEMLARAEGTELGDEETTLHQLKELEEFVRSGRGSISDFFNTHHSGEANPPGQ